MILEVAILSLKTGEEERFEQAFAKAEAIISSMKGYLSHELMKCIEKDHRYILLVRWETLKDHEIGFRQSKKYLTWKKMLHHFYEPFPEVEHYRAVK